MQQSGKKKHLSKSDKSSGSIRIIGGDMRGRKLHFKTVEGLRPTLDRIRETVFNWLARDIQNACCLDLFSGSGALGFEAISRGASQVTFVELNSKVARSLTDNANLLGINEQVNIINTDSDSFLRNASEQFDIIFLDPPFGQGLLENTLEKLKKNLSETSLVYIEQENSHSEYQLTSEWLPVKHKKTASFSYALYQLQR